MTPASTGSLYTSLRLISMGTWWDLFGLDDARGIQEGWGPKQDLERQVEFDRSKKGSLGRTNKWNKLGISMRKGSWQGTDRSSPMGTECTSNKGCCLVWMEVQAQDIIYSKVDYGKFSPLGFLWVNRTHHFPLLHVHPSSQPWKLARGKLCLDPCVSFLWFISSVFQ